jgi:hypothetical protein
MDAFFTPVFGGLSVAGMKKATAVFLTFLLYMRGNHIDAVAEKKILPVVSGPHFSPGFGAFLLSTEDIAPA